MEVLIIASPTDDLAVAFADGLQRVGVNAEYVDVAEASQLFTIELTAGHANITPSTPILFRPQMVTRRRETFDHEFVQGEGLAAVWSAVALTPAPVINRPGPEGLHQRMTDSPALNEARSGLNARSEIYCRNLSDAAGDEQHTWAVDLHAYTTSILPDPPMHPTAQFAGRTLPTTRTDPEIACSDEAYVLFTSGSTGVPKCVSISNRNVCAFLDTVQERYTFTESDRFTQLFDLTFDLSVFDLFAAWGVGACVCVPAPLEVLAPYAWIERENISVWFSVPSAAQLLLQRRSLTPGRLPTLRWSLFCGEALHESLAQAWQAAAHQAILENLYGPTELTIACSSYRWNPNTSPQHCVNGVVPIGNLHPLHSSLIVDRNLNDAPSGLEGELCVAGPQSFSGYPQDSTANERAFLTREELDGTTTRYFRTGDRVRLTKAGLAYMGRVDAQMKVRGHRVEAGEIESALRDQPNIRQAMVLGHPQSAHSYEYLVAFVCGDDIISSVALAALRQSLPPYMVPRQMLVLDTFPLTANGKINRHALREHMATTP